MSELDDAIAALANRDRWQTPPGHLSVKDLAVRAGVSKDVVKKWIGQGMFPNAYRAGDSRTHPWFIPEADIIAAAQKETR